ncbi:MAG: phosphoribosylformylglycinamidine synthase subunit PurQ [bacterium]|nr:phosphoribosylformylglycinamidine synthase subunit PurQ [bacterium]
MPRLSVAVVVFPGSNCDYDCFWAVAQFPQCRVQYVWHKDANPGRFDVIILPGGFSYGDYLRCGAIARFSPVMQAIVEHARQGRPLLGICNGFQILCEAGLLPGALYRNNSLTFICEHVYVRAETTASVFTRACASGQVLNLPIAHGEGQYFADDATLRQLEDGGQIAFRYCARDGAASAQANPNGSRHNIAGIFNAAKNVLGMMPHPERAMDARLGSCDGQLIFKSMLAAVSA